MHRLPFGPLRSILCLGAHCDDIEIGAGATMLALLAGQPGIHVHWVVLSSDPERAAESRASAVDLLQRAGSTEVDIRTFTDGFFPSENAAIKRYFETLKHQVSPDLVFTHHRDDRHQDHRLVSDLTWNTFRDHVVLEYEIPKYDGDLGQPNVYVPIEETDRALKVNTLIERYRSQASRDWFTRDTFNAIMRLRGIECRSPSGYAEAFHARKLVLGTSSGRHSTGG